MFICEIFCNMLKKKKDFYIIVNYNIIYLFNIIVYVMLCNKVLYFRKVIRCYIIIVFNNKKISCLLFVYF